ncbi:Mitochondrial ribosome protein, small subunit [Candida maltosa Xu316]|uniref:Small ribosomal subunit protein uS4m n=1 Tax=Candida maltosa (strain Xu316) TaxID=1245528 RepID=M3K0A7_CANMX|nr:Mitochondrial ribosome protein, small subunit [Candida maltosa Xu316]
MPRKVDKVVKMSRGRITMSMNKLNLFNLYRNEPLRYVGKTLYQQKWAAKTETRNYHGEHIRENQFKNVLFDSNLKTYSQLDASLKGQNVAPTPITLQTYAILEKRLETALFRSMFASSVRQARQFILGGFVKVNGVVMKYPSFPLKSGDVFSVDPEKVLYALGRTKPSLAKAVSVDNKQIKNWNQYVYEAKQNPEKIWNLKQNKKPSLDTLKEVENQQSKKKSLKKAQELMKIKQSQITRETILENILKLGNAAGESVDVTTFAEYGEVPATKCLQVYLNLASKNHPVFKEPTPENVAKFFVKDESQSAEEKTNVRFIASALRELRSSEWERVRVEFKNLEDGVDSKFFESTFAAKLRPVKKINKEEVLENNQKAKVNLPWQKHLFGRKDPSKAYFTPWKPRAFLGAFAILPHHIEISFETCHAIYLRDPIARPGQSEVISPFPDHVHERAYMHYVRKMPRLTGRLIREARRISPLLPGLLPVNRTIERALLELKWIKNELPENEWKQAVRQRSRFVPLQYILKSQPFGELNILCKKGVLIPRWETEEWCLRLTEHLNSSGLKNLSILDVCTGSGCIPLLMSHELSGTNANIYAFDVSEQAVSLANENLSSYKLKYNTQINLNIYQADVFDPEVIKNIKLPKLDLVTSNPPYIPQSDYIKPSENHKQKHLFLN